jgi:hypothetical protein
LPKDLRMSKYLSVLLLGWACLVKTPSTEVLCVAVDSDQDRQIDYMQCLDGCILYDADGDAKLDDRFCQDSDGCTGLDLNDDGDIETIECGSGDCFLIDADIDGRRDDNLCIKIAGCFTIDVDSDGTIDGGSCSTCRTWEPFDFQLDPDVVSECSGERFVLFDERYQKFIGAILCSPTRYKLVMSDSLDSPFFNIGDASGGGEDHCELANPDFFLIDEDDIASGGCLDCSLGISLNLKGGEGFIRAGFGADFFFDGDWIPNYFTSSSYECGVSLPEKVICLSNSPCLTLDRDGNGVIDTVDCSALIGCVGSDFNSDSIIDAVVCDPSQQL